MKKIKVLLSALAMVAAMAFVSCGGGAGDDPKGGESGSGASTPDDLVLYDSEVAGEVLEIDIEASYNNYFELPAEIPEGSGYKKINVIAKYETTDGTQAAIQLMTTDKQSQASASISLDKEFSEKSVACLAGATYTAWENNAEVTKNCADTAGLVQGYIQNSNANYATVTGKIYIKKAWLSAN